MAAICNTAFCKGCAGFASPHSIARAIPSFTTWICPNPKCKVDVFYSCKVCFDEDQGHQIVTTKTAAARHIKNKHNKNTSNRPSKQGKVSYQDEVSSDQFHVQQDDSEEENTTVLLFDAPAHLRESLEGYFERKQSAVFYEAERQCPGRGYRNIIAGALYRDSAAFMADSIREEDVDLHLDISLLLDSLPSTQHERLFNVMHACENNGKLKATTDTSSPVFVTNIPSHSEVDKVYLKGVKAIRPNLPRPAIHVVGNHAYVPIREAVRDLLAYPHTDLDMVNKADLTNMRPVFVRKLSQSQAGRAFFGRAYSKYKHRVLPLYLIKWSDGFDPFNVKNNRASHWVMTLSFSPPDGVFFPTDNSYVIAAGPSNESHHDVIREIVKEWESIKTSVDSDLFFYAKENSFVHVYIDYLAVIQDSPERTGDTCTPAGNGRLNARFGKVVDYKSQWEKIVACDVCQRQFYGNYDSTMVVTNGCDKCTCWNVDSTCTMLSFPPLLNFPQEMVPEDGLLPVIDITFESLMTAFNFSYKKLITGEWKSATPFYAYGAYVGIANKVLEAMVKDVELKKKWWEILKDDDRSDDVKEKIRKLKKEDLLDLTLPELKVLFLQPPPPPPSWVSGYSMECLSPSTMHLLCLNSHHNLIDKLGEFLAYFNLNEPFNRYATRVTKNMLGLGLNWLSVLEWNKKGGYVSENWLALTHVEKYYCAGAVLQVKNYQYEEPNKPVERWTVAEKKKWLTMRGIKVGEKARKAAVDKLFNDDRNKPEGPSPLTLDPGYHNKISKLMCSYCGLVASVMTNKIVEGESSRECEWHVKQFMTYMHDFQMKMEKLNDVKRGTKYKAWFVQTFSFINLLGFPSAMERWGSMRELWEGGNIGEGLLKTVKPLVPRFANNPSEILLRRWYEGRALGRAKMRNLKKGGVSGGSGTHLAAIFDWMKRCSPSFSIEKVRRRYTDHAPLMVVRFEKCDFPEQQRFLILVKDRERNSSYSSEFPYVAIPIRCTHFVGTVASCPFFNWSIDRFDVTSIDTSTWKFTHSCLLLPATEEFGLPVNDANGKLYYTVTSEFEEMTPDGSFLRFRYYPDTEDFVII